MSKICPCPSPNYDFWYRAFIVPFNNYTVLSMCQKHSFVVDSFCFEVWVFPCTNYFDIHTIWLIFCKTSVLENIGHTKYVIVNIGFGHIEWNIYFVKKDILGRCKKVEFPHFHAGLTGRLWNADIWQHSDSSIWGQKYQEMDWPQISTQFQ